MNTNRSREPAYVKIDNDEGISILNKQPTGGRIRSVIIAVMLLVIVGSIGTFIYALVSPGRGSEKSSEVNKALDMLFMCQKKIKLISKNPDTAKVPYIENRGNGNSFLYVWRLGDGLQMQNGFGAMLETEASCSGKLSPPQIQSLVVDGIELMK